MILVTILQLKNFSHQKVIGLYNFSTMILIYKQQKTLVQVSRFDACPSEHRGLLEEESIMWAWRCWCRGVLSVQGACVWWLLSLKLIIGSQNQRFTSVKHKEYHLNSTLIALCKFRVCLCVCEWVFVSVLPHCWLDTHTHTHTPASESLIRSYLSLACNYLPSLFHFHLFIYYL